jgi:hypothetical protein
VPVLNLPSVYIGDDELWQIPSLAFYLFSHVIQGKPDIDRLQTIAIEHLAERDFLHILAVMCSPDAPAIAAQFHEALGSEELYNRNTASQRRQAIRGMEPDGCRDSLVHQRQKIPVRYFEILDIEGLGRPFRLRLHSAADYLAASEARNEKSRISH